jgi:hypothetical protein
LKAVANEGIVWLRFLYLARTVIQSLTAVDSISSSCCKKKESFEGQASWPNSRYRLSKWCFQVCCWTLFIPIHRNLWESLWGQTS